ncbi:MAG TPA: hypothetical protein PLN52_25010, partial [Opitutaceae bacterium]|nr:hypothetical protein [Opitutaceae bacterium]
ASTSLWDPWARRRPRRLLPLPQNQSRRGRRRSQVCGSCCAKDWAMMMNCLKAGIQASISTSGQISGTKTQEGTFYVCALLAAATLALTIAPISER